MTQSYFIQRVDGWARLMEQIESAQRRGYTVLVYKLHFEVLTAVLFTTRAELQGYNLLPKYQTMGLEDMKKFLKARYL